MHNRVAFHWEGGELRAEYLEFTLRGCKEIGVTATRYTGEVSTCSATLRSKTTDKIAVALNDLDVSEALRVGGGFGCSHEMMHRIWLEVDNVIIVIGTPLAEFDRRGASPPNSCWTNDVPAGLRELESVIGDFMNHSPEARVCKFDGD